MVNSFEITNAYVIINLIFLYGYTISSSNFMQQNYSKIDVKSNLYQKWYAP